MHQNRAIFVDDNGDPQHFHVAVVVPKYTNVKKKIEAYGGSTSNTGTKYITLTDASRVNAYEKGELYYSYKYVDDCIDAACRLELDEYKIEGTAKRSSRSAFTQKDKKILRDWVLQPGILRAGNSVYKELAEKHPRHTWQAWRDHYLKQIQPTLTVAERKTIESDERDGGDLFPRKMGEAMPNTAAAGLDSAVSEDKIQAQAQKSEPKQSQSRTQTTASNKTIIPAEEDRAELMNKLTRRRRSERIPPPDRDAKLESRGNSMSQRSQREEDKQSVQRPRLDHDGNEEDMDEDDQEMDQMLMEVAVPEDTVGDGKDGILADRRVSGGGLKGTTGQSSIVAVATSTTKPGSTLVDISTGRLRKVEDIRAQVSEDGFAAEMEEWPSQRAKQLQESTSQQRRMRNRNPFVDLTESSPRPLLHGAQRTVASHVAKQAITDNVTNDDSRSNSQIKPSENNVGKRRRIIEDDEEYFGETSERNWDTSIVSDRHDKEQPKLFVQPIQPHPQPIAVPSVFFSVQSSTVGHETLPDQDRVESSDLEDELGRALGTQRRLNVTASRSRVSDPTPLGPRRTRVKARQSLPHPRVENNPSENVSDDQQLIFMRLLKGLCVASGCTGEEALDAMKRCSGNWKVARRLLCEEMEMEVDDRYEEDIQASEAGKGKKRRRISGHAGKGDLARLVWTAEEDALLLRGGTTAQLEALREKKGGKAWLERERFLQKFLTS